jgi:hypothetical protein
MAPPLSHQIAERVAEAPQLYHRLVLVVGPACSGKTAALRDLHDEHGWPLLNVNLLLSERLLELTARQRTLRVARIVDYIVAEIDADPIMLDNIEMLFHPGLKQDPLRLLQSLSRNRPVVATWRGGLQHGALTYATPDHPEFRRFDAPQALVVTSTAGHSVGKTTATVQEHSA